MPPPPIWSTRSRAAGQGQPSRPGAARRQRHRSTATSGSWGRPCAPGEGWPRGNAHAYAGHAEPASRAAPEDDGADDPVDRDAAVAADGTRAADQRAVGREPGPGGRKRERPRSRRAGERAEREEQDDFAAAGGDVEGRGVGAVAQLLGAPLRTHSGEEDPKLSAMQNTAARPESLQEHLTDQLACATTPDRIRQVAEVLVWQPR